MLKRIIHPSDLFVTFVLALHLALSKPQRKHLIRTVETIIVWQIYLHAKTVRRLNRKRPKEKRLRFRSKYCLAREMLAERRC